MKIIRKHPYLVILGFSFIAMAIKLFDFRYQVGGDGRFHASIILGYMDAIKHLHFNPFTIIPDIGANLGYATPLFYPTIMHYITAFLALIIPGNHNIYIAMDIMFLLGFFLSGVTMYMLCNALFNNNKIVSLIASAIYILFPFHLSQVYVRASYSESWIFVFLPLVCLGIYYLINQQGKQFVIYTTLGVVGMMYSHIMTTFFMVLFFAPIMLIFVQKIFTRANLKYIIICMLLILAVSAPIYISLLTLKSFAHYGVFSENLMATSQWFESSLFAPICFLRTCALHTGEPMDIHISLFTIILVVCSCVVVMMRGTVMQKVTLICFVAIGLWGVYLVSDYSILANYSDKFKIMQFSYRLVPMFCLAFSIVAPMVFLYVNKRIISIASIIIICGCGLFNQIKINNDSSIIFANNFGEAWLEYPEQQDLTTKIYDSFGVQQEYLLESAPRYSYDWYTRSKQGVSVVDGFGVVSDQVNDTPQLTFTIQDAMGPITIELPRIYYPGYEIIHNNKSISYQSSSVGLIKFTSDDPNGTYQVKYRNPQPIILAQTISIIGIICYIFLFTKLLKKYK